MSSALAGGFLTTAPPGKSPSQDFECDCSHWLFGGEMTANVGQLYKNPGRRWCPSTGGGEK